LILGGAVWFDYLFQSFGAEDLILWRRLFYTFIVTALLFLMLINKSKPFFLLLWIFGSYVFLQHFSTDNPRDQAAFDLLFLLFPINAAVLDSQVETKLFSAKNNIYLASILLQGVLIEKSILFYSEISPVLFPIGCLVWVAALLYLLVRLCQTGGIKDSSIVYGLMAVFMGFLSFKEAEAVSLYMMSAGFCLLLGVLEEYLYALFKDPLTGVYSRFCYDWKSAKSFPLKYSLGLVCVDNYDKLQKAFGARKTDRLIWLLTDILKSVQDKASIYRFKDDEFVLIFYEDDKKQVYEYLEELRRRIAGTLFDLQNGSKIRITVSAGVSEKKRSDLNAEAVLQRVREAVQRAYRFTQNVTSKV
jgi:diguanylate cyclase (GGDEF)-like protein